MLALLLFGSAFCGVGGSRKRHIVKSGDRLSDIARQYSTTVEKIVSANHMTNEDKIYVGQVLTIPAGLLAKKTPRAISNADHYIDVSFWDDYIDWPTAANHIKGVMIRSSYGLNSPSHVDSMFETNINGAYAAGIKCGIYHYSYASGVGDAENEADFVISTLAPYKSMITLPVAYDLEEQSIADLGMGTVTAMALAFCSKIQAAGYIPMIYTNLNWAINYVDMSQIHGAGIYVWMAQWGSACTYTGDYAMWQYGCASVEGVGPEVDANWCYVDFGSGSSSGGSSSGGSSSGGSSSGGSSSGIAVDGYIGSGTVSAWQRALGTSVDGVISGQCSVNKQYLERLTSITWECSGSQLVQAIQRKVGADADGYLGPNTVKAIQRFVGVDADGYLGANTAKAIQKSINDGKW